MAVVGAGPAGPGAAWFLTESGHHVTVYDAEEKPGGSLRYAIPEFRLPEEVLDRNCSRCGRREPASWASLSSPVPATTPMLDAGFDAVVIGSGSGLLHRHAVAASVRDPAG